MESQEANELWSSFSQEMERYLNTSALNNSLLDILNDPKASRFEINLDNLPKDPLDLGSLVINFPLKAGVRTQKIVTDIAKEVKASKVMSEKTTSDSDIIKVAFVGSLGSHLVTPRGLTSRLVNKLIGVQGIVTSISRVKPKLLKSAHYCEATKKHSQHEYNDKYALQERDTTKGSSVIPIYDDSEKRNPLSMEYGLSNYRDLQIINIQEMPEKVPAGLLSRSIEIVLQDDLVDLTKPGDRVQINGVFRPLTGGFTYSSGTFKTVVVATSVRQLQAQTESNLTVDDIKAIKRISRRVDLVNLLTHSMAPSVYGHYNVKKGCILQLVGGQEKRVGNNTRLRGDVNILLIGDPSTAKSQMLRHMLNLSPLSFNTTGRGSSGVGLTAAVTLDRDTGEKQLEAGAMVLADRGLICIDEFDKMSPEDRVSMHEVMEQQTVTIAKAGIHVSLNARCSVLAAANPIYGEFLKEKPVNVNIGYINMIKTSRFTFEQI